MKATTCVTTDLGTLIALFGAIARQDPRESLRGVAIMRDGRAIATDGNQMYVADIGLHGEPLGESVCICSEFIETAIRVAPVAKRPTTFVMAICDDRVSGHWHCGRDHVRGEGVSIPDTPLVKGGPYPFLTNTMPTEAPTREVCFNLRHLRKSLNALIDGGCDVAVMGFDFLNNEPDESLNRVTLDGMRRDRSAGQGAVIMPATTADGKGPAEPVAYMRREQVEAQAERRDRHD